MESYTATVTGFYTQFSTDDSVITFVQITPIFDSKGSCVNQIPGLLMHRDSDFDLAVGDVIDISIVTMQFLIKVKHPSISKRVNLRMRYCPVCHTGLANYNGMRFCINANCRTHIREHIYTMLSAIEFNCEASSMNYVIDTIITKTYISSPLDIFYLTVSYLCDIGIDISNAQIFIQNLHNVRGHVTFEQYFRAINILGMTPDLIAMVCDAMRANNVGLNSIEKLPDVPIHIGHLLRTVNDIDYFAEYWIYNKDFMIQLGKILYA